MLYRLRRHPIPIKAHFASSLVLTYAFPGELLRPLLPPGVSLYSHEGWGFLAIAMVQTHSLRPAWLPGAFGRSFFLSGFRIFSEFETASGRKLKGLRILRSYTDRAMMSFGGNLLTRYDYRRADVSVDQDETILRIQMQTADREADLDVTADLKSADAGLPPKSPFKNLAEARRFAGPLPFTFEYEVETNSIIVIQGVRQNWHPRPVHVTVDKMQILQQPPFRDFADPPLANAFFVEDIPYRWERGVIHPLPA
ncbi:DUF2071 domain-containing protein [Verrucomicrobiota bacterium sgz303538]